MRRKLKRALLYFLLYMVSVAVVLWPTSIVIPGSLSTLQGFLVVLALALPGTAGVLRLLYYFLELIFKPDDIVQISDAALEDRIGSRMSIQRLGEYLTHHRKFFAHRGLRRLYPQSEIHAWSIFILAVSAQTRGEISTAVILYSLALNFYNHYGFYNNRGIAYDDLENYQAALADYSRAIVLNPQYATAYNNRGLTYSKLEDCQAALARPESKYWGG